MDDKKVRVLRTYISPSTYCNHNFENVYYVPVEKQRIPNIRTEIRDLAGNRVSFKASKTPTKFVLHFRRIFLMVIIFFSTQTRHQHFHRSFIIMVPLLRYCIYLACRGSCRIDNGVGPI